MSGKPMRQNWIRRIALPRDQVETVLICFPHAGGSASYFSPFARNIAPEIEPLAVQYPGRQDRRLEEWHGSIEALVDGVVAELPAVAAGRAVALYGHSMGAIVAFEVCRRLAGSDSAPKLLVVSGRRAPGTVRAENSHLYTDAELVRELDRVADTPQTWLTDPELRDLLLPVVREDYRAIENYVYQDGPPIECPIVTLTGAGDPYVDADEAKAWSSCTAGEFELHTYPGGHFFVESQRAAVGRLISEKLTG
ncbi:alpha/beta fold hydrolase [Nocardia sp. NPDC050712]|uniref:thioesterase II family protein n=1 Tax=Nocardia sp. NPDC050712 TaxID=3155518 RepID=UPI0033FA7509